MKSLRLSENENTKTKISIEASIVILLCCFPLFYRLDALAIRQWDEARNAVSALEMLRNHNFIVRYFNGGPDYWDVKPPLLIWMQVLSLKILGMNELAVRMPSAIAALLSIVFLIVYFHRSGQNRYAGYLASLILVTSQGYIERHMARTGDHDALLVLFTTMIIFLYYEFLKAREPDNRILSVITALFIMGVFTKSIAVLMMLPGMLMMTIIYKSTRKLFLNRWFYICLLFFVLVCGGYYVLRETMQPGYMKTVWAEELFPRYLNTGQGFFQASFSYYIKNLFHARFSYWIFFLFFAIIMMIVKKLKESQGLSFYLLMNTVVFLMIISAGTKNLWYDGPLYPLMAAVIAIAFFNLSHYLQSLLKKSPLVFRISFVIACAGLFLYPAIKTMSNVARSDEFYWDEEIYSMCYLLRDLPGCRELSSRSFSIAFDGYNGHLLFYTHILEYKQYRVIEFKKPEELKPGDYVLISQQSMADQISNKYTYDTDFQKNRVRLIKIKEDVKSVHQ